MTTQLATIRKILEIQPIEGATKVVRARVTGDVWLVTGIANGFAEGNLVVYIRPDVFVPQTTADWLCDPAHPDIFNNIPGGTVRRTTIRSTLSDGLIMPTTTGQYTIDNPVEGEDVSDLLGVQDWAEIRPLTTKE